MGNWLIAVIIFVGLAGAALLNSMADDAAVEQDTSSAEYVVGNMMVYRNAVAAYASENPAVSGFVSDEDLELPEWFNRDMDVRNHVQAGVAYVYYVGPNNGHASTMLESADGNILVGVSQGGQLRNPVTGVVAISLPAAIPEAAIVFAPSALSTAPPVPPPPAPPTDCNIAAGMARSWSVGGNSCHSTQGTALVLPHLEKLAFTDAPPGTTGTAEFYCVNGNLRTNPEDGATCNPPPACVVAAGTTRGWSGGGVACAGPAAAAVVPSGSLLSITSNNGNIGSGDFMCTEGVLASSPVSSSCAPPPAPCVPPAPQNATETRHAVRTIACPAGHSGEITQDMHQYRSRSRSAYCPATTGPYAWNDWTPWTDWQDVTRDWGYVSDNCQRICTLPAQSVQTEGRAHRETRGEGCPDGSPGLRTYARTVQQQRSRSAYCPAYHGDHTWTGWSDWQNLNDPPWELTGDGCRAKLRPPPQPTGRFWHNWGDGAYQFGFGIYCRAPVTHAELLNMDPICLYMETTNDGSTWTPNPPAIQAPTEPYRTCINTLRRGVSMNDSPDCSCSTLGAGARIYHSAPGASTWAGNEYACQ